MQNFVFLLEQLAPGIYIFCGVVMLFGLRSLFMARQALAGAQFELEKEFARFRLNNAITVVVITLEVALAILALAYVVAPTLRAQPPIAADTLAVAVEETPFETTVPGGAAALGTQGSLFANSGEIPGAEDDLNLGPLATPTLTPTPVGTIIPDVPAPEGCDTPNAMLTIPANGMVIFEATNLIGSADSEDFAFYRFELNGPSTNNAWATHSDYTVPVINGELGQLVPSRFIPGQYRFRLTVYDITNTMRASCTVTIILSEPIPTATPLSAS
ncbi:MAG: hypothetical protein JW910_00705 [Anaerolineae bacterium]|nr:hypothetical protein [Anaerolineae bacterium]